MFRARAWICSLTLLVLCSSCSYLQKKSYDAEEQEVLGPKSAVIEGSYDRVWRATQKAMAYYPIRINNVDTGIVETEVIKGLQVWNPPHRPPTRQPGLRYYLKIALIKGVQGQNPATEVSVEKIVTIERNFFSGEERLPSDGLEEESILYRIQRELIMEKSLDRAYEQNKL